MTTFDITHEFTDLPLDGDLASGFVSIEYTDWSDDFRVTDVTLDEALSDHPFVRPACHRLSPAEYAEVVKAIEYHERQRILEAIRADEDEREYDFRTGRH